MDVEAKPIRLTLNIKPGEDVDEGELDHLTRQLRHDIQELEVNSVELVREGKTPAGAKVVDPVTLGALAIAVLPSVAPKLVEFLQSWIMRGEGRAVRITTKIGDRTLEFECSAKTLVHSEVMTFVNALTGKNQP